MKIRTNFAHRINMLDAGGKIHEHLVGVSLMRDYRQRDRTARAHRPGDQMKQRLQMPRTRHRRRGDLNEAVAYCRDHHRHTTLVQIASSLRADMIFGRDRDQRPQIGIDLWPASLRQSRRKPALCQRTSVAVGTRGNADTVVPRIRRTRLAHRTFECVLWIGN